MKSAIRAFNSILRPARLIYERNRADRLLLVSPRTSDLVIHGSKRRSHDRDKQTKQTDNTEPPRNAHERDDGRHLLLARATDERSMGRTNDLSDGPTICPMDQRFVRWTNDLSDGRTPCWTDESYVARMDDLLDGRTINATDERTDERNQMKDMDEKGLPLWGRFFYLWIFFWEIELNSNLSTDWILQIKINKLRLSIPSKLNEQIDHFHYWIF
jgi:hypothetical protein